MNLSIFYPFTDDNHIFLINTSKSNTDLRDKAVTYATGYVFVCHNLLKNHPSDKCNSFDIFPECPITRYIVLDAIASD